MGDFTLEYLTGKPDIVTLSASEMILKFCSVREVRKACGIFCENLLDLYSFFQANIKYHQQLAILSYLIVKRQSDLFCPQTQISIISTEY